VTRAAVADPAELVARIATARRARLLAIYRMRLRREDLEDCYSQATLELITRTRRTPFEDEEHVRNALVQKFESRIEDRRRALSGRSAIESAIAGAVQMDGGEAPELADPSAAVERQVLARSDLRRLAEVIRDLSPDQRLVLHCQVNLELGAGEFCVRYGWSSERFRKVAQRARAKLRGLVEEYQSGERCRRLEPDLIALSAGVGDEEQLRRARAHVANCGGCAGYLAAMDRSAREVAGLLPPVVVVGAGAVGAKLGLAGVVRRLVGLVRHPLAGRGGGGAGAAGVAAGSSAAAAGGVKAGIVALCIASAAGSLVVCEREGVFAPLGLGGGGKAKTTVVAQSERRPVVVAAPIAVHRLSAAAQTRLEFGTGGGRRGGGGTESGAGAPNGSGLAAQPPSVVSQEAREFGFEK
jgi:RNA polymerase sigma factor (sigma-70 family)